MPTALVTGAGGFIGHHMVRYLKQQNYYVIAVSRRVPAFEVSLADKYITGDLGCSEFTADLFKEPIDEVYQFAADMGGAGYTFSHENDANIMQNSLRINLNILHAISNGPSNNTRIFYPSSACVYPKLSENHPSYPNYTESLAYPANPESDYGWEKLFSERLYASYQRNYDIEVRIGRLHTIIGPQCIYAGGKEKVPAALARKVIQADDGGEITIWGSGEQTRSFLYVDDCVRAIYQLMQSDFSAPVNIGSEELVSINELAGKLIALSGKTLQLKHIDGPVGPSARNSDNHLIREKLGWTPKISLNEGLKITYDWIQQQMS
ncbi:NAD-dependent epimerase/dehydratase family protein [Planctobacterium marinum]|uniref:NAD-dependent epimerase/dehydratase family protein n=1 Tax=Planctobacterium marinum TaxID=1631968 RepID=UPI001E2A280A|nr:NAD-dependent epimerase/dehydratase family protein [Planctobacterium marinum]MCC2607940.1 NAD-dependent epimerase/dehydratase family protein [Planctobacterium marinum]